MNDAPLLPTLVGLAVALFGIVLLIGPAERWLGDPKRLATRVRGQLAMWTLFAAVIAIVVAWEARPLSSIGLRPLHWSSFLWAVVLVLALIHVMVPIANRVLAASGLPGFEAGMEKVLATPAWFRIFAVVTAGVVEETLFRGYVLLRLAEVTGSLWIGAGVSWFVFAVVHLPFWGAGPVLHFLVTSALITGFFVWRQDLLANALAHAGVDAMGLVVGPWLAARARRRAASAAPPV